MAEFPFMAEGCGLVGCRFYGVLCGCSGSILIVKLTGVFCR